MKARVVLTGIAVAALGGVGPAGPADSPGCTAFTLRDGERTVVGRNLDWPIGLGAVLLNPRGVSKSALVAPSQHPASWVSRFASVTFTQFGREFPLGGMNEAGLVVEELSYGPARYPGTDGRPVLNELQWIQYHLDNFATVDEVVAAETSVRIVPVLFGLHYFVADAAGRSAVIEYLDGASVVYAGEDLPVAVLSNDTYRNLLRYLGHHVGFGGTRAAGPGPEAPERFVRAAARIARMESASPLDAPVDSAFAVLDDVAQDDTQWSIVYDPVHREVRYRTLGDRRTRSIRLQGRDLDCAGGARGAPVDAWTTVSDPELAPWTSADNASLVARVFQALSGLADEPPPTGLGKALADYPDRTACAGAPRR
ncbi:MAG: linear amide C-N hydrolase [Gemmatimonadota bacterium]|jgi:choloylglycine hydrolase